MLTQPPVPPVGIGVEIDAFFTDIARYREDGMTVIASSSFQTQSMPLLHLISRLPERLPVYFLDTGFHFPETLEFRDLVAERFDLDVRVLEAQVTKQAQRTSSGIFLFADNPARCCTINKTLPMEPVLAGSDVWVTGVRRDQSSVRQGFSKEAPGPHGTVRYHPMIEWSRADVWRYVTEHDLPRHPLEMRGYDSIGCAPCTTRPTLDARSGRWQGQNKTECGLHTDLVATA